MLTSLSGGLSPQAHEKAASASGHPQPQLPMERGSFLLDTPGKSLLLITDSDWLALPSLYQPRGFPEYFVLRPQRMTLTKSQRGVVLQTHDAGRKVGGCWVVPSYRYPIQESTYKSRKYLTCCVSTSPECFIDSSLNSHPILLKVVTGWDLPHFTDESQT